MQKGFSLIEVNLAFLLMLIAIPCILKTSHINTLLYKKERQIILTKNNSAFSFCHQIKTINSFTILECKNENDETLYKIK